MANMREWLRLVDSSTVDAYNKKAEYKKVIAALKDVGQQHEEHEAVMVDTFTRHIQSHADTDMRLLAVAALAQLAAIKCFTFTATSLQKVRRCVGEVLREALAREGNLKEDAGRILFANCVHMVGARCDDFPPLCRDVLPLVLALWRKTEGDGSSSCSREAALFVLRLCVSKRHREGTLEAAGEWLPLLGRHLRRNEADEERNKIRSILKNFRGGVCRNAEDAAMLEHHAVRGLSAVTDFGTVLAVLEVCGVLSNGYFLDTLLAPGSCGLSVIDEAMNVDRTRRTAWTLWCQACAAAENPPLPRVFQTFRKGLDKADTLRCMLKALTAAGGLWVKLMAGGVTTELMNEVAPLLTECERVASIKGDLALTNEVWSNLINGLLVGGETLPAQLLVSHGVSHLCRLVHCGIFSLGGATGDAVQKDLADQVRFFATAFLAAMSEVLRSKEYSPSVKTQLLRQWIHCKVDPDQKVLSQTGLDSLRFVVSRNSLNGATDRDALYRAFVGLGLSPTLKMLLAPGLSDALPPGFKSVARCVALMVLRCRLVPTPPRLLQPDSLENSILIDFGASLRLIEAAGGGDFVAQMVGLSQDMQSHFRAVCHGTIATVVFRVRAWSAVAEEVVKRLVRDPALGEDKKTVPDVDKLLATLVVAVLAVFEGNELPFERVASGESQVRSMEQTLFEHFHLTLQHAAVVFGQLAERADVGNLASSLHPVVEQARKRVLELSDEWREAMKHFTGEVCFFLCCGACPAMVAATLALVPALPSLLLTDSDGVSGAVDVNGHGAAAHVSVAAVQSATEPVPRLCRLLDQVSEFVHYEWCRLSDPAKQQLRLRDCSTELVKAAASLCKAASKENGMCHMLLAEMPGLLAAWVTVGSGSGLLTELLSMVRRCCDDKKLSPVACMFDWLSPCLKCNRHNVFDPSLAFWNEYLCRLSGVEWDERWRDLMREVRGGESLFSIPEGVVLPPSVASSGGLSPLRKPRPDASPSLHLDDDDEEEEQQHDQQQLPGSPKAATLAPTQIVEDDPPAEGAAAGEERRGVWQTMRPTEQEPHQKRAKMEPPMAPTQVAEREAEERELELDDEAEPPTQAAAAAEPEPRPGPGRGPEDEEKRGRVLVENFQSLSYGVQLRAVRALLELLGEEDVAAIMAAMLKRRKV